jgi:hypothetical protein
MNVQRAMNARLLGNAMMAQGAGLYVVNDKNKVVDSTRGENNIYFKDRESAEAALQALREDKEVMKRADEKENKERKPRKKAAKQEAGAVKRKSKKKAKKQGGYVMPRYGMPRLSNIMYGRGALGGGLLGGGLLGGGGLGGGLLGGDYAVNMRDLSQDVREVEFPDYYATKAAPLKKFNSIMDDYATYQGIKQKGFDFTPELLDLYEELKAEKREVPMRRKGKSRMVNKTQAEIFAELLDQLETEKALAERPKPKKALIKKAMEQQDDRTSMWDDIKRIMELSPALAIKEIRKLPEDRREIVLNTLISRVSNVDYRKLYDELN